MKKLMPFLTTTFLTFTGLYAPACLAYDYGYNAYGYAQPSIMDSVMILGTAQAATCIVSALIGGLFGAFFSHKLRKFRKILFSIMAGLCGGAALFTPALGQLVAFVVGFIAAYLLLSDKQKKNLRNLMQRFKQFKQTVFGSSTWATLEHLEENNLTGDKGLFLGMYRHRNDDGTIEEKPITYQGDRHLITVAAARAGKGVSSVIPNLLTHTGSVDHHPAPTAPIAASAIASRILKAIAKPAMSCNVL
jgi:type IV secretory pathway TraG/TraD family ATPase VirD4